MATIFISHAGEDDDLATGLEVWLKAQGFDEVFVDHGQNGIRVGDKWQRALQAAVGACRVVICIVTENWLRSKECDGEFIAARYMGKKIIPLIAVDPDNPEAASRQADDDLGLYRDALLQRVLREDQGCDLRASIRDGALDFSQTPEVAAGLVGGLRAAGALSNVGIDPRAFEIDPARLPSPFPGLSAFDDEDHHAAIFYGRDPEIIDCMEHLRQARANNSSKPIGIIGASGSGKSSLMRAGILPRLRRERPWVCLRAFRPGADPLLSFADAIARTLRSYGARQAAGSLAQDLRAAWQGVSKDEKTDLADRDGLIQLRGKLDEIADELRRGANRPGAVCLIPLDQAEELFESTQTDADILADYLRASILPAQGGDEDDPTMTGGWRLLFTIRTDSYSAFQTHPRFKELEAKGIDLRPLPIWRFDNAIDGPAGRYGVSIEGSLIERLVTDAPQKDSLPLLAFTMQRLFLHSDGKEITLDDYDTMGGISGILEDAAERAMRSFSPNDERPLPKRDPSKRRLQDTRGLFLPKLVSLNAEGQPVRHIADLAAFDENERDVAQSFLDWRLLVQRGKSGPNDQTPHETIEVAHEAIFREWSRLVGWLEPEKGRLEALRLTKSAARVWDRHHRKRAYCDHRDARLKEALSLASDEGFSKRLTDVDLDYLQACRRHQRRARVPSMLAAAAALGLVALAGTVIAGVLEAYETQRDFEQIASNTNGERARALSGQQRDNTRTEAAHGRSAAIESVDALRTTLQGAPDDVRTAGLNAAREHILGYSLNASTAAIVAAALRVSEDEIYKDDYLKLQLALQLWSGSEDAKRTAQALSASTSPGRAWLASAALTGLEFARAEENGFPLSFDAQQINAPEEPGLEGTCGAVFKHAGDFDAAGGFDRALSIRGAALNVHYWRAECHRKTGTTSRALDFFQAGIDSIRRVEDPASIASEAPGYNRHVWGLYRGLGTTQLYNADTQTMPAGRHNQLDEARSNLSRAIEEFEAWGGDDVGKTFTGENLSFVELRTEMDAQDWLQLDFQTHAISDVVPLYWNETVRLIVVKERARLAGDDPEQCQQLSAALFETRAKLAGIGRHARNGHRDRWLRGEVDNEVWSVNQLAHGELTFLVTEAYAAHAEEAAQWASDGLSNTSSAREISCQDNSGLVATIWDYVDAVSDRF